MLSSAEPAAPVQPLSVEGMTYDEVAMLQNVAVGTVEGRVNRARQQLAGLLQMKSNHEIAADHVMQAAMQESMSLFT